MSQKIIQINPVTKDYAWGNKDFIPSVLGTSKTDSPCAELWMGTHPLGDNIVTQTGQTLSQFLDQNPDFAGCKAKDFPFLFKVLAIDKPLSIQCHPNKQQAQKGFEEHNPNYKDPNEKAEMYYALTPSKLLCGFRKQPLHNQQTTELFEYFNSLYPNDSACQYAYKLNLIELQEGEAICLKPGIPHAYLSGNGIELMTNSDNVIRAGLTPKQVDLKELYKVMIQSAYEPNLCVSVEDKGGEHFYSPAGFVLTAMKDGYYCSSPESVRIMICTQGKALINEDFVLSKGMVCLVSKDYPANVEVEGSVFCASC